MRDEGAATVDDRAARRASSPALGLELLGTYDSPVAGAEGNREAFALLRLPPSVQTLPPAGAAETLPAGEEPR